MSIVALPMVEGFTLYGRDVGQARMVKSLREHRTYEKAQTECVRRIVQPGWTFIDGGACLGYYTLLASRLVGPSGLVLAFEPSPLNFDMVARAVADDRDARWTEFQRIDGPLREAWGPAAQNIHLYQAALADGEGLEPFGQHPHNIGDCRVGPKPMAGTGRKWVCCQVQTFRLDWILAPVRRRLERDKVFLKLDVQGCEPRALDGARTTIGQFRPVMMVEIEDDRLRAAGSTAGELHKLIAELGYEEENIEGTRDWICRPL